MSQSRKAKVRARLVVMGMMAVTGAAFFYGFLTDDMARVTETQADQVSQGLIIRYIVAMALGGLVSGAIFAGMFGRMSIPGWVLALLGAVLASLIGGLVGSAIGLLPDLAADGLTLTEVISIGFGLVLIPLAMAGRPFMIAVWVVLMVATQIWAGRVRRQG
ncbi:MAG: hypothetical protein CML66_05580 [Rhodobacteraceae bacterium]|nr:hypothetical protein [Paracoccaceae bacterium]QEW21413.1 hypothetical protein LA6_003621 [Marinibacterium anthonyi]